MATPAPTGPPRSLRYRILTSLTLWIVVGAIIGLIIGQYAPKFATQAAPTAQIFLRIIQFVVFPLVFSSLVVAIASNDNLKATGVLGIKAFIYFEIVALLALVIGLVMVNIAKPGSGLTSDKAYNASSSTFTYANWINHLTPKTWSEATSGELLQTLVAALVFGCAAQQIPKQHKDIIIHFFNAVMLTMFKFVEIIIWTAPVGVLFAVAAAVASAGGLSVLATIGKLVALVYGSLLLFMVVVFGPIFLYLRINPITFIQAMKTPLFIAYTTATSEAALPAAFEALEAFGVSQRIYSFIIPFGYAFNLDGSTLYLSLASIFCAQVVGLDKTIGEQIVLVLMLMVSSKGVAGVRSASIVVLASTLETFGIPNNGIFLIVTADWFMDMARTFTNVFGNCLAAVLMAKVSSEFRVPGWDDVKEIKEEINELQDVEVVEPEISKAEAQV
ncbi:hypothetical protein HK101_002292 [Irineochytrium annulatum]|nr:hypothetical protein HK101_002292 [Irineochytrium annulatum]